MIIIILLFSSYNNSYRSVLFLTAFSVVSAYVCVRLPVCMYACGFQCACACVCAVVCVYACVRLSSYVCVPLSVCMCACDYLCVFVYVFVLVVEFKAKIARSTNSSSSMCGAIEMPYRCPSPAFCPTKVRMEAL